MTSQMPYRNLYFVYNYWWWWHHKCLITIFISCSILVGGDDITKSLSQSLFSFRFLLVVITSQMPYHNLFSIYVFWWWWHHKWLITLFTLISMFGDDDITNALAQYPFHFRFLLVVMTSQMPYHNLNFNFDFWWLWCQWKWLITILILFSILLVVMTSQTPNHTLYFMFDFCWWWWHHKFLSAIFVFFSILVGGDDITIALSQYLLCFRLLLVVMTSQMPYHNLYYKFDVCWCWWHHKCLITIFIFFSIFVGGEDTTRHYHNVPLIFVGGDDITNALSQPLKY